MSLLILPDIQAGDFRKEMGIYPELPFEEKVKLVEKQDYANITDDQTLEASSDDLPF